MSDKIKPSEIAFDLGLVYAVDVHQVEDALAAQTRVYHYRGFLAADDRAVAVASAGQNMYFHPRPQIFLL